MQQAQFDNNTNIYYTETTPSYKYLSNLQSGMFMDRPDLWHKPNRKHKPSLYQKPMFLEFNPDYPFT